MFSIKKFENFNKKKEGFTLIEVIAVIAIIGMLAVVLLPKIGGYIKEAKKLKVVENCRRVVMAVESYNLKTNNEIKDTESVSAAMRKQGVKQYLEDSELKNISPDQTTLKNCYSIVEGADFDFLEGSEILNPSTIEGKNSAD